MSWHEDNSTEHLDESRDGCDQEEQRQLLLSNGYQEELKRGPAPWRLSLVICAFVAAGFGLIVLVVLGLSQEVKEAQHEVAEALGVHTTDYILDTNWDSYAPPQRREYTWTIRDQVHNPDGVYRPMILVNNQFPGPLIEANDGDTIVVHIDNKAVNATSIHWHGLYQNSTPWMDGTVGVTQCPIAPGMKFTYEFTIKGQHGTTWWHGHQGVQTADGLHGPIVIHSPKEKELQRIQYDTDQVILLSDYYYDLSSALMFSYLMPDAENAEPVPDTALINGLGIRDCDSVPNRRCNNSTAGVPSISLAANKRHRLRIVNVGAFAEFQFEIDEHLLAVTEVDGTDVAPESFHRLNISPAQRYSVIIDTNVSSARTFWMRARMITGCFTDPPATLQANALAVVRYDGDAGKPESHDWEETLPLECRDMNTTGLVPTEIVAAPATPDAVFYLRSNFEIGAYRLSRGFFNTSSWRADVAAPGLARAIDGLHSDNKTFDVQGGPFVNAAAFHVEREMVVQSTGIQTIDLLISNFDDGNHPLHLHGYKYFVLAQGHGAPPLTRIDAGITRESLAPLYAVVNTTNPLRRDTASVEAFGWILLRFVADNPGMWAFHCHVSWHAEAGLLMQFLTRSDELANMPMPYANADLCKASGLEKGMGPEDAVFADFAK
ncbi:hypothetical protein AMS68_002760 [Peltaster fructicola]|uniref:Multicopper oxidase n=1 Tax=Peltaster fructicola TaxID=286661 RepID=A0A6H0XRB3_9PEZI|nr:hypothetical protein AMS68_002760 [Peltaster fructicola]